jgi:Holliday junction resolvase RusA-like endonuclease
MQPIEFELTRWTSSLNQKHRQHWSKAMKERKIIQEHIKCHWINMGRPVFTKPVLISLTFICPDPNRQRDPDNYLGGAKALIDGLKKTFFTRDDVKWAKLNHPQFVKGPEKRLRIRIEEQKI